MVGVGLASLREVTARRVAMGLAGLVALAQLLTLGLRGGPLWSFLTSKALDREQYLQIRGDVFDKGDGLLRLRGQSGQFVEWMNRNDPPGPPEEGIRIVAVISEIPGRHLGRAFAWYVQLRRPDLVVLEIARDAMQPDELDRCVDPDRVRYLVFLRKDAFGPCCDASGKFDPPFSHQSDSFGFRYERLIESLLARADPVEGLPPVYRVRP
jgi:hypothetical protein